MADPATVGMLVAGALSLGSEAAKAAVGEAVKDAYHALKSKVACWAAGDVAELQKTPNSHARKAIIAEIIDGLSIDERSDLLKLAQGLIAKVRVDGSAIGVDIGRLDALQVEFGNITVTSGIGTRIEDMHVDGSFKTGDISVGLSPGKQ